MIAGPRSAMLPTRKRELGVLDAEMHRNANLVGGVAEINELML